MSKKSKTKHIFRWFFISLIGLIGLGIVIVPPMINLNYLKPMLETKIFEQTGIKATIHGDVNFGLLGQATIVMHNISVPNGIISSCEFAIPFTDIFTPNKARLSDTVKINGAFLDIEKIVPFDINKTIELRNSKIKFLNKEYEIINAELSKHFSNISVRTDQHKYEIKSVDNNFIITNKNNDLSLSGQLLPNGTATATISITAQNINKWFEFEKPQITGHFPITADITWNGSYGLDFYNISADGTTGHIIMQEDGYKIIQLKSYSADYDMSFILKDSEILQNASFDMDFYGNIKFADKNIKHLYVNTIGQKDKIEIKNIIADDLNIRGGYIDKKGAHNLQISLPENDIETTCIFSGTPTNWTCTEFSYGKKIFGTVNVSEHSFNIDITSKENITDVNILANSAKKLGDNGTIKFQFANMAGTVTIVNQKVDIKYDFINNKNLSWAKIDLPFIPDFMKTEKGNFVWVGDTMTFTPHSKSWYITTKKDHFYISGDNFKKWMPELDLSSIRNMSYMVYGNYKRGNISNLTIEIDGHKFTGSANNDSITLKTDSLNMDFLISPEFKNNFEELSFFVQSPIMIPFGLKVNLSLSAESLIYDGKTYNNFVYSLKKNSQTFSVSDSLHGNLLANIHKNNSQYDIDIQLNKFVLDKKLLTNNMPLNISDSNITADIKLKTNGKIAHDIKENIKGTFNATFEGGTLYGLGMAEFYASSQSIKDKTDAEYAISRALEDGVTPIKKLHIIGTYDNGDIKTTTPFVLSMKHVDTTGQLEIIKDKMTTNMQLILRGISSDPAPIELKVNPNGSREYSLNEIMKHFDPYYMQTFIQNHDKF